MKIEEEKPSIIKSFIRSSFSSKKSLKKHLIKHSKTSSLVSTSSSSVSSTTPSSSTSTSSLSLNESNAENSDVFFGEGMSVVLEAEKADITRKNNMILECREAASSNEKFNKKSDHASETENATPSTNYFVQLSQKFEARPKIQKLGEKLKTLIAPREQQHFVHFRRLFDSYIPEGDNLIMTFPCSYQSKFKDFPLHGRMYLTLSMIGFNSSLFGYEKKIIIHLRDITSLKKDRSSRFSINSIKILTQSGDKHSFGSLKSRDRIYSLLFRVLRMNVDPNNRDAMIEDDDELDEFKAGDNTSVVGYRITDNNQMTASDTSSEGSDENSYNSTHSNVPATNTDIPTTIEPVIPVECQCREHKGRKLLDIEIPLSVEQTFKLLFTDNEWLNKFEISLKRSENKCTTWNEEENTGKKERVCIYTMELDNTFGPKSTKITETQICNPITSYSEGYTIIKEAINEGVPYCDSFSVECIYCVTKVSETKSRLKVHGGITFKKYIFGLIKGVIERSAITGLDSYYNALNQKLKTDEEHLLSFITVMDLEDIPIIADETPNENGITASTHSDAQLLTSNNRFADRVVSLSNLKESTVPPTAAAASANADMPQTNGAKTVILLLKIIAVLLFLIFISNIWFNIFSNRQQPQTIPSGPSASSLEELSELRKMVVSLESKFNTFLTGAKKEL